VYHGPSDLDSFFSILFGTDFPPFGFLFLLIIENRSSRQVAGPYKFKNCFRQPNGNPSDRGGEGEGEEASIRVCWKDLPRWWLVRKMTSPTRQKDTRVPQQKTTSKDSSTRKALRRSSGHSSTTWAIDDYCTGGSTKLRRSTTKSHSPDDGSTPPEQE